LPHVLLFVLQEEVVSLHIRAQDRETLVRQAMIERIPIMTVDRQSEPYDARILWGN
jgi:hypothetical protein